MLDNFYKDKRVLVTGGAGFIGSHLAEKLVNLGALVCVLDNLSTGNIENIRPFADKLNFIEGSVTDLDACLAAAHNCNIVFHLAAEVSVAESQKNPYPALTTNTQGTLNVAQAAHLSGVKMLVFASSAAVYGNHEGLCSEELTPAPVSTYGHSKLFGEHIMQLYAQLHGLPTVSMRFFNVHGPRQNYNNGTGGVLAVFEKKLKGNEPLAIFGDGTQTRDFVPVSTIVESLLRAGMFNKEICNGQAFNIGTGRSISLNQKLAELLQKFPDYNQEITYLDPRPGDIKHSACDCSKFQKAVI